jgi:hypothetical protein
MRRQTLIAAFAMAALGTLGGCKGDGDTDYSKKTITPNGTPSSELVPISPGGAAGAGAAPAVAPGAGPVTK